MFIVFYLTYSFQNNTNPLVQQMEIMHDAYLTEKFLPLLCINQIRFLKDTNENKIYHYELWLSNTWFDFTKWYFHYLPLQEESNATAGNLACI